jgi:hypothetical protein
MSNEYSIEIREGLEQAFLLCTQALDVLDACGAPETIGVKLQEVLETVQSTLGGLPGELN